MLERTTHVPGSAAEAEHRLRDALRIARIEALPDLRTLVALGRIAHDTILDAFGLKRGNFAFAHGARHELPSGLVLFDSYHCSRQNTSTGRLTTAMFEEIVSQAAVSLHRP